MYGLSAATDLSFLHGRQVIQVCLGANDLLLHFFPGATIAVQTSITLSRSGDSTRFEELPSAASALMQLIDRPVLATRVRPPGDLILTFEDDVVLEIHETSLHYECYQIRDGSRLIVV